MSNGLFDDIDLTTVISDETIRQRFVVSSEQITGEEAEVSDPPGDADRVFNATQDEGFDSIQDAIDEANDRDTIQLNDDTFEEDLTIDVENITIEALVDVTIIGVVTIEASGVRIEGCEFAPDADVEQIVFVAANADNVEIEDCSFSGTADIALVFEGDEGEVINCVFDDVDVTEHILVVDGTDVEVSGCTFRVINEIEVVRVEAGGVEIDDCDFNAVDVVVERFIVVVDAVVNVIIRECDFAGEVEFEVVELRADDSRILDCNLEDVVKTNLTVSIIVVTGNNADVERCVFLVSEALESVVLVEDADGVDVDDCSFDTDEAITVERFIIVRESATNVIIVRCTFAGSVSGTTIEHDGSGDDSEIRECEFGNVELDDDATLISRVDDVTVEEIDVQIIEIQFEDDVTVFTSLADAISAVEEGDEVIVQPGTYVTDTPISISTPDLDIRGPKADTPGDPDDSNARSPDDPEVEAIVESPVIIEAADLALEGFSFQENVSADVIGSGSVTIQNNIIDIDDEPPAVDIGLREGGPSFTVEDNLLRNAQRGVNADVDDERIDTISDELLITGNTIEAADAGIELIADDAIPDGTLTEVRDDNEFIDTEPAIIPEPGVEQQATLFDPPEDDDGQVFAGSEAIEDAIEEADEGARIEVAPGTYEPSEFGRIFIEKQNLEIVGPQEGTPGNADGRQPGDPETEAVIEGGFDILATTGTTVDGFSIEDRILGELTEDGEDGETIEIQNNIIEVDLDDEQDRGASVLLAAGSDAPPISVENNQIETPGPGIRYDVPEISSADTVTGNTIREAETGIIVGLREDDPSVSVSDVITDNTIEDSETGLEIDLASEIGIPEDAELSDLSDDNELIDTDPAIAITPGRVNSVEATADEVTTDTVGTYTADLINDIDTTDLDDVVINDPRLFNVDVDFEFIATNGVDADDIENVEVIEGSGFEIDGEDLVDGDASITVHELRVEIEVTFDEDVENVSETLEVSIDDEDGGVVESDTDTDEFTVDL